MLTMVQTNTNLLEFPVDLSTEMVTPEADIELFFPFDVTLHRVDAVDYATLEHGLTQRLQAMNSLLADLYTEQRIIKAGVLPKSILEQMPKFYQTGKGITPPKNIYVHLASFDVIRGRDNQFYVQRDNINTPSGAAFPASAGYAGTYSDAPVLTAHSATNICDYDTLVRDAMDAVNTDGIKVVLSNPLCNPLFFEHAYLADRTRSELAFPEHLEVYENTVYYRFVSGPRVKVGSVLCTSCDDLVNAAGSDDLSAHTAEALLDAYRAGNVAIMNAPGCSIAEAPAIFHRMPDIIRFYTGQEPVLANVPSYRGDSTVDLESMLSRLSRLVLKEKLPDGSIRVVFGRDLDADELSTWRLMLTQRPERYTAQEVGDFVSFDTLDTANRIVPRKADFRVYAGQGKRTRIWNSGL
ncbi:MAG: circularly permuted type 2 ATP-grasp protein [Eubacteriales bacterium]|nr:circularly permuted type 2 ATP-grasp protein [Eubacteriales bacterium]